MDENVLITLRIDEVEGLIDDLYFTSEKFNLKYEEGAGKFQEKLADKIDLQLQNHLKKQKELI